LTAYNPEKNRDKASQGSIKNSFDFLGIQFHGNNIRPSIASRRKLLQVIDDLIKESIKIDFSKIMNGSKEDFSLTKISYQIHNKVKGWGNQYYFCNDLQLWKSLDAEINIRIRKHLDHHFASMRKLDQVQKRRQLGIHLLIDSKSEPIIW
jgi:hypothetical protein